MGLVALLAIALLLLSPPVTNSVWAQQCQAAPGGPPCERAGGPSSLGDPAGVDLTVGNPFHPLSGNKYQEEVDAAPEPGVPVEMEASGGLRSPSRPSGSP